MAQASTSAAGGGGGGDGDQAAAAAAARRTSSPWREYMVREIGRGDHAAALMMEGAAGAPPICAVPRSLLEVRPRAFAPRLLAMGLLSPRLEPSAINSCKALCVQRFMARHSVPDLDALLSSLVPDPVALHYAYSDLPTSLHDLDSLRLALAVDAVFLHEFLLYVRFGSGNKSAPCGYLCTYFGSPNTLSDVWRDLFLAGNQIPMPLLQRLAALDVPTTAARRPDFRPGDLERVINHHVPNVLFGPRLSPHDLNSGALDFQHLLDWQYVLHTRINVAALKSKSSNSRRAAPGGSSTAAGHDAGYRSTPAAADRARRRCCFSLSTSLWCCRRWKDAVMERVMSLCCRYCRRTRRRQAADPYSIAEAAPPPSQDQPAMMRAGAWKKKSYHVPTASQLSRVGVRFKAREGNVSVMRYHKSKLRFDLPRLRVADGTEDVLRNLLAYEQASTSGTLGTLITMYVIVMDSLIDGPDDVDVLTAANVIENQLGSDTRLVDMWNDMGTNVVAQPSAAWEELVDDVWEHYGSHWRVLYVEFRNTYFSRPWRWASLIVAAVLLVLTAIQTYYTWLPFYEASSDPAT